MRAKQYLWAYEPDDPGILSADLTEYGVRGGKPHRFVLRLTDGSQAMTLQHGLASEYMDRGKLRSTYVIPPVEQQIPAWVPAGARAELLDLYHSGTNNVAVPRKDIPNLVQADAADVGEQAGTVDRMEGHHMAPVVYWKRAAPGAFKALKPGGEFEYYFRGANPAEAAACANALRNAGFKAVEVISNVLIKGIRP